MLFPIIFLIGYIIIERHLPYGCLLLLLSPFPPLLSFSFLPFKEASAVLLTYYLPDRIQHIFPLLNDSNIDAYPRFLEEKLINNS